MCMKVVIRSIDLGDWDRDQYHVLFDRKMEKTKTETITGVGSVPLTCCLFSTGPEPLILRSIR